MGRVEGDVVRFRGIRYAVADRFEAPRPVPGWTGERDASTHGPQCHQIIGPLDMALGGSSIPMSEDCLSLSVTTPACDDAGRPVIVWVHGGAFQTGTGAMPWYHGGRLARRGDVVVVSINYRLGLWGFAGDTNCGTLDQIAALEWVRDNIAAFGGDPTCVTVVGESAGGASVVSLLAAPATAGLVHRAWAMSPSILQFRTRDRAAEALQRVLDAAGAASLDDLRARPNDDLLAAQAAVLAERATSFDAFAPTAGGDGLPGSITEAAAANPVPLVVGTTRDECTLFVMLDPAARGIDRGGLLDRVEAVFPGRADDVLALYDDHRPGATPAELLCAIQTDEMFRTPAQRLVDARVETAAPTWTTWFTWSSSGFGGVLGACHGLDIPFAFDNLHQPGVVRFTGDAEGQQAVADAHSEALLAFARTGTAGWDPVGPDRRPTLQFDVDTRQVEDPEPALRALWGPGRAGA